MTSTPRSTDLQVERMHALSDAIWDLVMDSLEQLPGLTRIEAAAVLRLIASKLDGEKNPLRKPS